MNILGIIGGQEIIIILIIVLILFGGKKIPELMRGLGKGVKEYKNAVNDIDKEIDTLDNTEQRKIIEDDAKSDKTERNQ